MLNKICNWLAHSDNKVAPIISLRERFGVNLDFIKENYLFSLDDFAQRVVCANSAYLRTSIESDSVFFINEDTSDPKEFQRAEVRLWKFDELKFISEISKLLKLEPTVVKLDNYTDGYCLGTLFLDYKYAIFVCFNEVNLPISILPFLKGGIRPFLIRFKHSSLPEYIKKFLLEYIGIDCHITELFSLSNKGLIGGDIKYLLNFKGTRQKQEFNLEDLKKTMDHKDISDLHITIIEASKIRFTVRNTPFSLTLKYSDIPEFYNSRQQCAKESWETLFKFAKSKNEHRLLYSPTLKNRLKELRNFFRKFKDEDAFGIYQEIEYNQSRDGKICTQEVESRHRARGTKITYAKPLFELDVIEDDYNSNPRGRY